MDIEDIILESVVKTYANFGFIISEMGPEARRYRELRRKGRATAELYGRIPVKASRMQARRQADDTDVEGETRERVTRRRDSIYRQKYDAGRGPKSKVIDDLD